MLYDPNNPDAGFGQPRRTRIFFGFSGAGATVTDKHYQHTQSSASTSWTVTHGLGKRPAIQVFDSAGTQVEGLVTHVDTNTATISFSAAFSGTAYCN